MSASHQSLKRMLAGAVLRGSVKPASSRGARARDFECVVERITSDTQMPEWTFDVALSGENGSKPLKCAAAVRWAGAAPVISLHQVRLPSQRLVDRAEVVLHNGLFAGMWVSEGVRGHIYGVVEHEHVSGEHAACYVIERSGEALREWWTGNDWTHDAQHAQWYEHEPDPARETGDEGAHAAYYPHGVMESG